MNRNFCIGVLIVCFGSSSVNLGWATEVMEISPIVVQPAEIQELSQQVIDQDRKNRDEEIAIKSLIEENNKLVQGTLARQQDEGLAKIDQTMLSYRQKLFLRDQARIMANSQRWSSRYGDLIALTEDADAMTQDRGDLQNKSGMLTEKYQLLTELRDEMIAVNNKLEGQGYALHQKEQIYRELEQQEHDKINMLVTRLDEMDRKISHFDEIIAQKDRQIAELKNDLAIAQSETSRVPLSPNPELAKLRTQVVLLKDALQEQIEELKAKEEMFKKQQVVAEPNPVSANLQDEIIGLRNRIHQQDLDLKAKNESIHRLNQLLAAASPKQLAVSESGPESGNLRAEIVDLRNKTHQQELDLQTRDGSIRWLNQVLAATKNKAEYYRLTTQQDRLSLQQVQREVRYIKNDFERNLKEYNQFENIVFSLKNQVIQLGLQLSQKQAQVDSLKSELEDKIAHGEGTLGLARQLVDLQHQEASLLQEKSMLALQEFALLDGHVSAFENRIKVLLANHQIQAADLQSRLEGLQDQLSQKEQQVESLKTDLENKVTEEKDQWGALEYQVRDLKDRLQNRENQINILREEIQSGQQTQVQADTLRQQLADQQNKMDLLTTELKNKIVQEKSRDVLEYQIRDLRAQLQENEDQISTLKTQIQSGQQTQAQAETLRKQLIDQQNEADLLKQELESKTTQSGQMTQIMSDYQKKLESKDNAYNQQLQQVLLTRNTQAQMEAQIADLSARLQEKEAQVIKIEKNMYDLQAQVASKDRDLQAKDLNLSMEQQKTTDEKIRDLKTQLALARQQLNGMPSSDEIDFLKAGLKKATLQLEQKDQMLAQTKINADGYEQKFRDASQELQSLKGQLQSAYDEISHDNQDLKSKDLVIVRLKETSAVRGGDLQDVDLLRAQLKQKDAMLVQVKADADEYSKEFKNQSREFQSLKVQLQNAYDEIARKNEDLKYKDMAITRLKEQRSVQKIQGNPHENNAQALQAQLENADGQIKDLQDKLSQLKVLPDDRLREKLKQALYEIDEQGRAINLLVRKLHEAGQSVDLSKDFAKPASN